MNFNSDGVIRALSRDLRWDLPASDRNAAAAKTKFDSFVYSVAKAHLDLAVKTTKAAGGKTVQQRHVALVEDMATALRMRGGSGSTVLPSEYFGSKDSGAYFPQEATPQGNNYSTEQQQTGGKCPCLLGGSTVLPSEYFGVASGAYSQVGRGGGGERGEQPRARLTDDMFAQVLREYRQRVLAADGMRFTEDAKSALQARIMNSVADALKRQQPSSSGQGQGQRRGSALTAAHIDKAAKKFVLFPARA